MAWVVGIGIALFLVFAFPKQVGVLVLIIVGVVGAGMAYWWQSEKRQAAVLAKIKMTAAHQPDRCSSEYPILLDIRNDTGKTINRVSFTLEAYRPGYSEPVVSRWLSSDKIIVPFGIHTSCWSYRYSYDREIDGSTMDWRASASSAVFE